MKGMAAHMLGRWKESLEVGERAEQMLREEVRGIAWELDLVYLYSLLNLQFMGEFSELRRRLARFLKEARERDDLNAITNLRTRIGYIPYLASDEPDQAESEVTQGIGRWSREGFQLQHYYAIFARAEVMLYTGAGLAAWHAVDSQWGDLKRSFILHSQNVRVEALQLRARAALAAACDSPRGSRQRSRFLRIAERQAQSLLRENAAWAVGQALLVRAGVAAARGHLSQAVSHLEAAEQACLALDMNLHVAAARRRRGELSSGEAGAALQKEADAWMSTREIRNPIQMTALLAPGDYANAR
jgi:eukaryotic-like serine/threonine-protein kinase